MGARSRTLIGLAAALALCALSAAFVHQAEAATPRAIAGGPLQATRVGVNQVLAVPYYSWNNKARYATVVLPLRLRAGQQRALAVHRPATRQKGHAAGAGGTVG